MRFRFVEDRRTDYPVTIMCGVLGVSPAGYYAWRARPESQRSIANRELVNDIKRVHRDACGRYGSLRDGVVGGRAVVQISISWIGMIVRIKWSALQQTHGYE